MPIVRPPGHPRQGRSCISRDDLIRRVAVHKRHNKAFAEDMLLGPALDAVLAAAWRAWTRVPDDLAATVEEGGAE